MVRFCHAAQYIHPAGSVSACQTDGNTHRYAAFRNTGNTHSHCVFQKADIHFYPNRFDFAFQMITGCGSVQCNGNGLRAACCRDYNILNFFQQEIIHDFQAPFFLQPPIKGSLLQILFCEKPPFALPAAGCTDSKDRKGKLIFIIIS